MSEHSQQKQAREDHYLLYPPLPRRVHLVPPDMVRCYECGIFELTTRSIDTWRMFPHEDGEWDDYCPGCAARRLSSSTA